MTIVHLMDYTSSNDTSVYHTICGRRQKTAGDILHSVNGSSNARVNILCIKCEDRLLKFTQLPSMVKEEIQEETQPCEPQEVTVKILINCNNH